MVILEVNLPDRYMMGGESYVIDCSLNDTFMDENVSKGTLKLIERACETMGQMSKKLMAIRQAGIDYDIWAEETKAWGCGFTPVTQCENGIRCHFLARDYTSLARNIENASVMSTDDITSAVECLEVIEDIAFIEKKVYVLDEGERYCEVTGNFKVHITALTCELDKEMKPIMNTANVQFQPTMDENGLQLFDDEKMDKEDMKRLRTLKKK